MYITRERGLLRTRSSAPRDKCSRVPLCLRFFDWNVFISVSHEQILSHRSDMKRWYYLKWMKKIKIIAECCDQLIIAYYSYSDTLKPPCSSFLFSTARIIYKTGRFWNLDLIRTFRYCSCLSAANRFFLCIIKRYVRLFAWTRMWETVSKFRRRTVDDNWISLQLSG